LPLLAEAEQDQLLVEWNSTQAEYPMNKVYHLSYLKLRWLEPQMPAVVFEEQPTEELTQGRSARTIYRYWA